MAKIFCMMLMMGFSWAAQADQKAEYYDELVGALVNFSTLEADILQQNERGDVAPGRFVLKRSKSLKFYWEVGEPFNESYFDNGSDTYLIDNSLKQVVIKDSRDFIGPVTLFKATPTKLRRHFEIEKFVDGPLSTYILAGKSEDEMKVIVTFLDGNLLTFAIHFINKETKITFVNSKMNHTIDDKVFKAIYSADYDVIDERQMAQFLNAGNK